MSISIAEAISLKATGERQAKLQIEGACVSLATRRPGALQGRAEQAPSCRELSNVLCFSLRWEGTASGMEKRRHLGNWSEDTDLGTNRHCHWTHSKILPGLRLCLPALFSGYWQTFATFESHLTFTTNEAQRNGRVDKFMANE